MYVLPYMHSFFSWNGIVLLQSHNITAQNSCIYKMYRSTISISCKHLLLYPPRFYDKQKLSREVTVSDSLSPEQMKRLLGHSVANSGGRKAKAEGPSNETNAILYEFFKPFNKQTVELLNDSRYEFNSSWYVGWISRTFSLLKSTYLLQCHSPVKQNGLRVSRLFPWSSNTSLPVYTSILPYTVQIHYLFYVSSC